MRNSKTLQRLGESVLEAESVESRDSRPQLTEIVIKVDKARVRRGSEGGGGAQQVATPADMELLLAAVQRMTKELRRRTTEDSPYTPHAADKIQQLREENVRSDHPA